MALKVYYVRADWCLPCRASTDSLFLPNPDGTAGSIVNEYFQAREAGEIQFFLADITDSADLDYYESFFGALVAPAVILRENSVTISRLEGIDEIQDDIFAQISASGVEPDPIQDIEYDIVKTKTYPNWWLLLLGSTIGYYKTQQTWFLAGVPLSLAASTQYHTVSSIGKIVNDNPPGLEECTDGNWTTSRGRGRCSYHGGTLTKRVAKTKENSEIEIIDLVEIQDNDGDPHTIEIPVLGVYRYSSYTTKKGKTGNSIEVDFYEMPAAEIRQQLKDARFWWNRQQKVWLSWDKEAARQLILSLPLAQEGEEVPVLTEGQLRKQISCPISRALPIRKGLIAKNRKKGIIDCIFANANQVERYENDSNYLPQEESAEGLKDEWTGNATLHYGGDGQYVLRVHSRLWYEFESNYSKAERSTKLSPKPLVSNDVAIVKMRALADRMEEQIEEKYNPATAHQNPTARRARIMLGMEQDGDRLKKLQTHIRAIAQAREMGDLPASLNRVSTKIDVQTLLYRYTPKIGREKLFHLIDYIDKERVANRFKREFASYPVQYIFPSRRQLSAMNEALSVIKKDKIKWLMIVDTIKDLNRLFKLGIENEQQLLEAQADLEAINEKYGQGAIDEAEFAKRRMRDKINQLIGMKIPGYFPTPKPVLQRMTELLAPENGARILEPSAGAGDIADYLLQNFNVKADVIEINQRLREILKEKGYSLIGDDFLEFEGQEFDLIYMNPPFEKLADIDHVRKAFSLLAPGGQLVSVMSESPFFRQDNKAADFRNWLDEYGYSEKLPAGSFLKSRSSTGVNTRLVLMEKQASASMAGFPHQSISVQYV